MKKNILVLILVLLSSFGVFSQKIRTTAVFDADTSTRPKVGFYGIGVRANNIYFVPPTGNNIRLANYSLFTGLSTNYLPKWNGSKLVNSAIYESGSSVGIGTETPSVGFGGAISNVKLALLNGVPGGNNGTSTILLGGNSSHYSSITSEHTGAGLTYLSFGTASTAANPTEKMRITSSGNVGIGTTNPLEKIHLNYNGIANAFLLTGNNSGGTYFGHNADNRGVIAGYLNTDIIFGYNQSSTLTETARIVASTGNVGIGTASPTSKLQVVGLPVYADNAAATSGGLTAGAFYRTSTGVLMVVY